MMWFQEVESNMQAGMYTEEEPNWSERGYIVQPSLGSLPDNTESLFCDISHPNTKSALKV